MMGRISDRVAELEEQLTEEGNRAENYLFHLSALIEAIDDGTIDEIREACRKAKNAI